MLVCVRRGWAGGGGGGGQTETEIRRLQEADDIKCTHEKTTSELCPFDYMQIDLNIVCYFLSPPHSRQH